MAMAGVDVPRGRNWRDRRHGLPALLTEQA